MRRQIDSHGLRRFVPARELGGADDLVEEPLTRAVRDEPIVLLGEHARVERRLLAVCVEEPAKQNVLVGLLAELARAVNAVALDEQRALEEPRGRDRGVADLAVIVPYPVARSSWLPASRIGVRCRSVARLRGATRTQ